MIDEPITSEDAVQSNKLFSRKSYLKQFEPPTVEKELNDTMLTQRTISCIMI